MSAKTDKIMRQLASSIREGSKPKTSPYDTTATVRRVEGGTAWVHIPGGVDETPVKLTISAKPGDAVQVRVTGGRAFLVGNATAPPTDDTTAQMAVAQVGTVSRIVQAVKGVAERTARIAGNTAQYFWHTETGTDTGAHITEIPQEQFEGDPENGGGNLLLRSNGLAVRDGLVELATFERNGMRVMSFDPLGNPVDIAHLGFEGNSSPYYTFGKRNEVAEEYDSARSYSFGDLCIYDSKLYVCIISTTAGDAWDASHWQGAVGSWSVEEGELSIAAGHNAHAEGLGTMAIGSDSHTEGTLTIADGASSHAAGRNTRASGDCSYASGAGTKANGDYSFSGGEGTIANGESQTVIGKYNSPNTTDLFQVGNGTSDSSRSNAFAIGADGTIKTNGAALFGGASWAPSTGVSVASGAWSAALDGYTFQLSTGMYLVAFGADFSSNDAGYRMVQIKATSTGAGGNRYTPTARAVDGNNTRLSGVIVLTPTASTEYAIYAYQNSGSALTVAPWLNVIRLK